MQTKLTLVSLLEKFPKPGHGHKAFTHGCSFTSPFHPTSPPPPPPIIDTYS